MGACPTGALVSPGVLDARKCLAWLVQAPGTFPEEHRVALGGRIYGCDECQQVCPINKVADRREPPSPPPGSPQTDGSRVDLLDLLEESDDQLMEAHGRWYIAERNPRYLRRNALVALGNVGDGHHPGTERALRRWLVSGDPLLAEHARWAASRLGRRDLIPPTS
jgi:epoxyqueuosine reductase